MLLPHHRVHLRVDVLTSTYQSSTLEVRIVLNVLCGMNKINYSHYMCMKQRLRSRKLHYTPFSREGQALLDLSNGETWVETLGACSAAVQDGVASVHAHAIVQVVLALLGLLVTRIGNPSV